jgi:hypothetical protein
MKRVNYFTMLAAAFALTAGITGCIKNEAIETGEIKPGKPTAMEISIYAPHAPKTYAADLNATDEEMEMESVNVLIYAETSVAGNYILEKNAFLERSAFESTLENSDTYKLKGENRITTTTGNKKLYVVMNYPTTGVTPLPAVGSQLAGLPNVTCTISAVGDLYPDDKFIMSSVEEKPATLEPEATPGTTPDENKVAIAVKRLAAKVTVQEHEDLRESGDIKSYGGTFTDLQFAIGNANKSSFLFQKKVGASPSVVKDPNWESYNTTDFLSTGTYQAVNAAATAVLSLNRAYTPENTAETYASNGENLTYISVRANYKPAFFCDGEGKSLGDTNAAAKTFWIVANEEGAILYFDDKDNADAYASTMDPAPTPTVYTNGFCYFRAYINKNGAADSGIKAAKFDVLRNNYYKATINSIQAPGSPTDAGKVEETTSLMVDITVQPWTVISDGYDLY